MKQYILLLVLMVMGAGIHAYAEDVNPVKEGNVISGHVVEKGTENSLPYATILIVETGQGTVSNEDGEFRFKKVPAGKYTLRVQLLGYETQEKKVTVSNDFTVDVHFLMSDESIMTDEVVVSANRNETSRKVAPVVVNVMNARLFESVNSTDLAKSLNYQSGLRVENNCQNCGFPQVRINGLEGPYSQILINSRPVVSALSGVYGLEQIPVNMIERVEVVRGGGSALFGANAVGGTINIITKDLFRLAETYLLRAEAKFYQGNPIGAAEDVNVVRRRANAKKMFTTVTIGDIADERARELYLEEWRQPELTRISWCLARSGQPDEWGETYNLSTWDKQSGTDLNGGSYWYKRTTRYNIFNHGPIVSNKELNYQVDKRNLFWPIPNSAITANTGARLRQNYGYDGYDEAIPMFTNWEEAVADEELTK